jgi:predicted nucleic acid-binding protein
VIIWDTGALVAAADADDQDHARCVELMRRTPRPLLVPYPVLTEVCYLLRTRARHPRGGRFPQSS